MYGAWFSVPRTRRCGNTLTPTVGNLRRSGEDLAASGWRLRWKQTFRRLAIYHEMTYWKAAAALCDGGRHRIVKTRPGETCRASCRCDMSKIRSVESDIMNDWWHGNKQFSKISEYEKCTLRMLPLALPFRGAARKLFMYGTRWSTDEMRSGTAAANRDRRQL